MDRCEFSERVAELRVHLNNCVAGKKLPENFRAMLSELKREEERLLKNAVEDYRGIRLREKQFKYEIKNLISNEDDEERLYTLTDTQRCAMSKLDDKELPGLLTSMDDVVAGVTATAVLGENGMVFGLEDGNVMFATLEESGVKVNEIIKVFSDAVADVLVLVNDSEYAEKTSLAEVLAVGYGGEICVLSQSLFKLGEWRLKDDSVYKTASAGGTAVLLGMDGNVYYMEQNYGRWHFFEEPIISGYYADKICAVQKDVYLLSNVDHGIDILNINRINTPDELWQAPLF